MMVSCALSPISSRSPSINVMGSSGGLVTLDFFQGPSIYCYLYLLTQNGVLCPSSPPSPSVDFSSSSIWCEGDLPLCSESCHSCSACCSAVHSFSNRAFSSASFLHCMANLWTAYFASSLFFFSAKLPMPFLVPMTKSNGECQSIGHHLMTSEITSSVPRYGRLNHLFFGSFLCPDIHAVEICLELHVLR